MKQWHALACWLLLCSPAAAMVGGAPPAPENIARAVVMIVGARGSFCTGAAIAPDLILTAAHCVLPGSAYKLVEVPAGRAPVFRDVAAVARHPRFNLSALHAHRATADVALLRLAEPLPQAAILPVEPPAERVTVGDRFTVVGYGVGVRGDPTSSGVAREARLAATGKPGNLQLRLVDPATQGRRAGLGACTGDSGAPVLQERGGRRAIVGVVSWSTGPSATAGCGGLTGVTPLDLYAPWVAETAKRLRAALDRRPQRR